MQFDARQSIDKGLQHLAERLNPLIAKKLDLGDLPWTTVLSELDKVRGRATKTYAETDLLSQLKVITERLGHLGFPFDDHTRIVSSLGSELRIVRNRWAHNDELDSLDAWRSHDFAVRLLEQFGDTAGVEGATKLREEAFSALVYEQREAAHVSPLPSDRLLESQTTSSDKITDGEEVLRPDSSVLFRADSVSTPILGSDRYQFESWTVVPVGEVKVLDDLRKKAAKEQVRAVATEIAEFEGPIHIDRVAKLTSEAFGLKRLAAPRANRLKYQIKQMGLHVDKEGFVWPSDIDPSTWREFRPNDSTIDRELFQISTVEIANVFRFIKARTPNLSSSALDAAVLRAFGRRNKTKPVAARLEQARAML